MKCDITNWRILVKKKDYSIYNNKKNTSKKDKNKKRKVNSFKLLILFLIILLICFYVIWAIVKLVKNPTNTVVVKVGTISKEENAVGYIIRDETIVKGENYKNGM